MNRSDEGSMYALKVLFLLILAVLVAYLLMTGKSKPTTLMPAADDSIRNSDGLYQAQDQLDAVNVDSVDGGVIPLNSEVATY